MAVGVITDCNIGSCFDGGVSLFTAQLRQALATGRVEPHCELHSS